MTDKELLELAAKACGMTVNDALSKIGKPINLYSMWNPLADDGDALRLSAHLSIDVMHRYVGGQRVEAISPGGSVVSEDCNDKTRLDATRRAIVRAAAEIGKAMP